jgi:hypothetical protein
MAKRHITQHKRFVPYGTHSNFCFAKTSFMLEMLYAEPIKVGEENVFLGICY